MLQKKIDRRRAIRIVAFGLASSVVASSTLLRAKTAQKPVWHKWEGEVLGALSSIELHSPDKKSAENLISKCVEEMQRLESIFSLHQDNSQINRLNSMGHLEDPAAELVSILNLSNRVHKDTDGAFDITVQPLWSVYADHFFKKDKSSRGPLAPETITKALRLVDQSALEVSNSEVRFKKTGMAITLNGIAQGFITDKISQILKSNGIRDVIIDLGEIVAMGHNEKNAPWTVGLLNPNAPLQVSSEIELSNMGLATSGGYGLEFGHEGTANHIFNPKTGHSSRYYKSVSVVAQSAAVADALSTGLTVMPENEIGSVIKRYKAGALITRMDGSTKRYGLFPKVHHV
ncbi:MAG: FAD:protein FMN transferase [Hyphomicrobiaceae bacterium]|nr:FAD:protein FMN transferase [Hyphomicrobiaceae bacterium]